MTLRRGIGVSKRPIERPWMLFGKQEWRTEGRTTVLPCSRHLPCELLRCLPDRSERKQGGSSLPLESRLIQQCLGRLRVTGCLPECVGATTGAPQTAADLRRCQSRQPRANCGHRPPFAQMGRRRILTKELLAGRAEAPLFQRRQCPRRANVEKQSHFFLWILGGVGARSIPVTDAAAAGRVWRRSAGRRYSITPCMASIIAIGFYAGY